jgi:hypothetical protein
MQLPNLLSTVSLILAVLTLRANAAIPGAGLVDAAGRDLCVCPDTCPPRHCIID